MARIGIPRALFYYDYFPLWRGFFEYLGQEVVVSRVTNKSIFEAGLRHGLDESCLPVKVYMGHVLDLKDRVDFLFVPRLVSLEEKHFNCPKFIGLPDMVKGCFKNLPPLLEVTVDTTDNKRLASKTIWQLGRLFTRNPVKVISAYRHGLQAHRTYRAQLKTGLSHEAAINQSPELKKESPCPKSLKVALLSHPYNICDPVISSNIVEKLQKMGVQVITADSHDLNYLRKKASALSEHIYWTFEKKLAGAAVHYLETGEVDGMIMVVAFECGPDSLVAELIEREARGKIPIMTLSIDEHTGEAGLITRLEAFVDMLRWQKPDREIAACKEEQ